MQQEIDGKSRFLVNGENHSLSILVSSTTFDSSFTNQRLKETEGDPHTYVVNARKWDVKPQDFSKERFYVFCGSGEIDPCILDSYIEVNNILDSLGLDRINSMSVKETIEYIPSEFRDKIIDIPIDYLSDFKQNLLQSIQDIAGMTIAGQGKLFNNKELFNKAIYISEEPAFIKDTFIISTKLETRPQDYINPNWKPEKPERLRFMHIDQGITSDHYGLSSCYIDEAIINSDETITLKIKYDFILNIIPPRPPAKVDISKVRSLIPWLAQNKGINWGKITYDQYQSQESMQELEKASFPVAYQSVDKTDEAYLLLVDYLYEEKIKFPYNDEFERNLFNLVHFREKRKVDHTSTGCFSVDTKISLVDGRELSIKELLEEQNKGKINWVYTINESTKLIEPKPIKKIFKTKTTNDLVKVVLDNNEEIICTSNHLFMNRDLEYLPISNFKIGDSLMPLYRKYPNKGNIQGYRMYYEPIENKWHYEHRQFCLDPKFSNSVIHHVNFNKQDNTPTNLKRMSSSKHTLLHNNSTKDYNKISNSLKIWWKNNKNTELVKQRLLKQAKTIRERYGKKIKIKLDNIKQIEKYFGIDWNDLSTSEKLSLSGKYSYIKNPNLVEFMRQKGIKEYNSKKDKFTTKNRIWCTNGKDNIYILQNESIPEGYYKGRYIPEDKKHKPGNKLTNEQRNNISKAQIGKKWYNDGVKCYFIFPKDAKDNYIPGRINHKIKSIEPYNITMDVYDLEIKDNHNFALSAGVFVHNSKDISDSVAGSLKNAIDSDYYENILVEKDVDVILNL